MTSVRILKEDNVNLLRRRCLSVIPFLFAITAFVCSYMSNFGCTNIQFIPQQHSLPQAEEETTNAEVDNFFRPRALSFGLWMYQSQRMTTIQYGEIIYTESCTGYDPHSIYINTTWKVARILSVLSIIMAGFLLVWQFSAPFLLFDSNYWRIAILLFILLAILQGGTLLFVMSSACYDNAMIYILAYNPILYPTQCNSSWDTRTTRMNLVSIIFYAITAISMIIIPAPGIRPKERPYPMMVWDTKTIMNKSDQNYVNDDNHDDDDENDSIVSFADDIEVDRIDDDDDDDDDEMFHHHNHSSKSSNWRQQQDVTETSTSSFNENYNDDSSDAIYVQKGYI